MFTGLEPNQTFVGSADQRVDRDVQYSIIWAQLEQMAIQQWQAIPIYRIRRLIRSMMTSIRECIQSNGTYTHY